MSRPPSKSYLLRLWREHDDSPLHATLIPVGQPDLPQHFITLEALFNFLHVQAATGVPEIQSDVEQAVE